MGIFRDDSDMLCGGKFGVGEVARDGGGPGVRGGLSVPRASSKVRVFGFGVVGKSLGVIWLLDPPLI